MFFLIDFHDNVMYIKIFFPYDCIQTKSGVLIGRFYSSTNCYYILSIIPQEKFNVILNKVNCQSTIKSENYEVLGLWLCCEEDKQKISQAPFVCNKNCLILKKHNQCFSVVMVKPKHKIESIEIKCGVIIFFKSENILHSRSLYSLMNDYLALNSKTEFSSTVWSSTECDFNELYQSINLKTIVCLYSEVLGYYDQRKKQTLFSKSKVPYFFFEFWIKLIFFIVYGSVNVFKLLKIFKNPLYMKFIELSSTGTHFLLKVKLLLKLQSDEITYQEKLDIIFAFFYDAVLGVFFCIWIYSSSHVWFYAFQILMPSVDYIAKQVICYPIFVIVCFEQLN